MILTKKLEPKKKASLQNKCQPLYFLYNLNQTRKIKFSIFLNNTPPPVKKSPLAKKVKTLIFPSLKLAYLEGAEHLRKAYLVMVFVAFLAFYEMTIYQSQSQMKKVEAFLLFTFKV